MRTTIKKPSGGIDDWVKRVNDRIKWGSVENPGYPDVLTVWTSVDMHAGLTPREIKARIEEFVRRAEELEKEAAAGG